MAIVKDACVEKIEQTRQRGLEVAHSIIDANNAPSNPQQIEALKIALEMYKTFAVKQ